MNCCCPPGTVNDLANTFDAPRAKQDARQYRRRGLNGRGRQLISYLLTHTTRPLTVLDVGCGAGGVHHELLRRGVVDEVVGVDAAPAYLAEASDNAAHFGLETQTTYVHADFALQADRFQPADLVIMDRVICCYPDLPALLGAAAVRSRRYLALSFPREKWWLRLPFYLVDVVLKLFGSGYHPYLHRHSDIEAIALAAGLQPVHQTVSGIWQIMVFGRPEGK
jgi:2-polyprenyl-3-methyl-5-hydroxy-6-metoxy-1,4-benzoquinol methylase